VSFRYIITTLVLHVALIRMGATASKPADASASTPRSRGCSAWSWRDSEDDSKSSSVGTSQMKASAPSSMSVQTAKTETQTQMLVRVGEIPAVCIISSHYLHSFIHLRCSSPHVSMRSKCHVS
jgi:hypothetical protein